MLTRFQARSGKVELRAAWRALVSGELWCAFGNTLTVFALVIAYCCVPNATEASGCA
jgi:hypothetical protein